ncbi:Uncharacterised protein [Providencia rustigianii]|uniref:Uncharacterized protein n=1 Tax=Providencia rustigianii TaxID=158850 RepID=A0A379G1W2_9GAMM|nr:hypothetical protein [Providencia rustigianii]SUC34916.1 Uncharacterised protein [Providencia rustigianii]
MSNNTRYSASRVFAKNDLITIKKLLREDKSPKEMYQYLASKGDRYALFAGVDGRESGFLEERVKSNHHFENMIGHLSDNMSSMNHSSSFFDRDFSVPQVPSMPEFNYSGGYSSPSSRFSF